MADYHCSVKAVSRGQGRSATAAAAYRSASEISDLRTGEIHDYSRKAGVVHSEIVLPSNAPEWARDRSQLWNAAEQAEARKDAKVAREWEVGLPHELSEDGRKALALEYARHLSDRYGIAVDVSIHAPGRGGDQRNHHAHILGSTRELGPDGFGAKTRVLDSPLTSGPEIEECRQEWAAMCNRALERERVQERVDHRSLAEQRSAALASGDERRAQDLDRAPTEHMGPKATAMERDGIATGRGDRNRQILSENAERQSLWQHIRELGAQIRDRAAEGLREAADKARLVKDDLAARLRQADLTGLREANLRAAFDRADTSGLKQQEKAIKQERTREKTQEQGRGRGGPSRSPEGRGR